MINFLSDPVSLVAITLAAFAGFKLWRTFGDNNFAPPTQAAVPEQQAEVVNKVVEESAPIITEPVWKGFADDGSEIAQTLTTLHNMDKGFTAKEFMTFAKAQFENVSTAYAEGNLPKLKANLEPEILQLFQTAISQIKAQELISSFKLIGITAAKITDATIKNNRAELTVEFKAEVISATNDKQGTIKSGSLEKVSHLNEEWTFARQLDAKNAVWLLSAT